MSVTLHDHIEKANQIAFSNLIKADPIWVDVSRAIDVIPGMEKNMILHAGPPVEWERMCPTLKNGMIGGALYEGWIKKPEQMEELVRSGEVLFHPCHDHDAVGSMAGITTPSMWVYVVEDKVQRGRSYSGVYEGRGKTLAFGCYAQETIDRLRWMNSELGPILERVSATFKEGLPLKPILAKALHMGDECHNRYVASTLWFADVLTKALLSLDISNSRTDAIYRFMTAEHYNSFLTLSMAGCKAMARTSHGVGKSSMVTVMARNGTDFGIKISGLGNKWFTAPAAKVEGVYYPGHGEMEANPDIGDSSITETVGLGGFALVAAPATMQIVGKSLEEAITLTREMREITIGDNETFTLPYMNFLGTPTGIDLLKVVETGITPVCVTAIASTQPNTGMIGAGFVRQPLSVFHNGLKAFSAALKENKDQEKSL
jgi:hypothetical protein